MGRFREGGTAHPAATFFMETLKHLAAKVTILYMGLVACLGPIRGLLAHKAADINYWRHITHL